MTDIWADIMTILASLAAVGSAIFAWRATVQAKRSVDTENRPILVFSPGDLNVEFHSVPNGTVKNFGNRPAIVHQIEYWGVELEDNLDPKKPLNFIETKDCLVDRSVDIISPFGEYESSVANTRGYYFSTRPNTRFVVKYSDHNGRDYVSECSWDEQTKIWRRSECSPYGRMRSGKPSLSSRSRQQSPVYRLPGALRMRRRLSMLPAVVEQDMPIKDEDD